MTLGTLVGLAMGVNRWAKGVPDTPIRAIVLPPAVLEQPAGIRIFAACALSLSFGDAPA